MALHQLEPGKETPLKAIIDACNKCLENKEAFPSEALAAALQQLSELATLPLLFMRTMIQTVAAAPKLHPFILNLLRSLVARQARANSAACEKEGSCALGFVLGLHASRFGVNSLCQATT